mgnify:CR=1 FL=1
MVPSGRGLPPVLRPLVNSDKEYDELVEIEGATSSRLVAQSHGYLAIDPRELAYGVPNQNFINAAFSYPRPQMNRFNGTTRGAWYAAFDVETCLREVAYHKSIFLTETRADKDTFDYAEIHASLIGPYADMRNWQPEHPALGAETASAYPAGNLIAEGVLDLGASGVIYPSVRHEGGTCIAVLQPQALQAVQQGALYELTVEVGVEPTYQMKAEASAA